MAMKHTAMNKNNFREYNEITKWMTIYDTDHQPDDVTMPKVLEFQEPV